MCRGTALRDAVSMDAIAIERPHGNALRKGRRSLAGQRYLVTTVTIGREPLFTQPDLAIAAAQATLDARMWDHSRAWCWVLMPDHWHALIELGDGDSLAALMQRVKSNIARATNLARGGGNNIWQPGYHEHVLREDEDLLSVARYVIANPKRAGLVATVGDYPYWNAAWL